MSYNFKRIVSILVLSMEDFKPMIPGHETVSHVKLQLGVLAFHLSYGSTSLNERRSLCFLGIFSHRGNLFDDSQINLGQKHVSLQFYEPVCFVFFCFVLGFFGLHEATHRE